MGKISEHVWGLSSPLENVREFGDGDRDTKEIKRT